MSVAQIIRQQINAIDRAAFMAWGVKQMIANTGATHSGLQFKTTGMVKWKGWVDVKYNEGTDLYDIDFFRIRAGKLIMDRTATDVYAEDLVSVIDSQVG
jgi:hypothetical protein